MNTLQRSIRSFLQRQPYSISQDNIGEYLEYFIKRNVTLPKVWGLMVGDFAHNLRSSLDYIIYALNRCSTTPIDEDRCQFPIFDRRRDYSRRGKSVFPCKPSGIDGIIEKLQPYHRRKYPELELLSILRDLDNADKHRTITPIFDLADLQFGKQASRLPPSSHLWPNYDTGGYIIVLTPEVRKEMGTNINPQLSTEIVFEVKARSTGKVSRVGIPTLHSIYVLVYNDIIPQFDKFLQKSYTDMV